MSLKNTSCKICGYKFHECGSCDHTGVPWLAEGCCCVDCWQEYMDGRIEALSDQLHQTSVERQDARDAARYFQRLYGGLSESDVDMWPWIAEG